MSARFLISGSIFSEEELNSFPAEGAQQEYIRYIQDFLKQWRDQSDLIIAHTSGSTGNPKEIKLSKSAMKASARATGLAFGINGENKASDTFSKVICSPLSARYIAGMMMIVRALEWDVDLLCLRPSSNPLEDVDQKLDFMVMTPHQLNASLEKGNKRNLDNVRQLLLGGSPLNSELEGKIKQLNSNVFLGYGMTETMSHIALRQLNGTKATNRYLAVEGVQFTLDNRDCLVIHAPHLGISDLVTNDIVVLHEGNSFSWLGRYDHVINSGGVKLFPELIEAKIDDIIAQGFYIRGQESEKLGEELVIILEGEFPDEEIIAEWTVQMSLVLDKYEMPRKWLSVPEFQYTETGKIKR